jgi:hypothetical protein
MPKQKTIKPQRQSKHPARWEKDLNPERLAGQNIGEQENLRSAADIKELRRRLREFTPEELAQVPIVAPGERLRQGAVYLDLRDSSRKPFTATGELAAEGDHLYVAKSAAPHELWNRLLGREGIEAAQPADEPPDEIVDQAGADSFPNSDPPSWTTGREPAESTARQAPPEKRADPEESEPS